jgi:hypothetical protein
MLTVQDAHFDIPARPAFAPGTSPFKLKASAYRDELAFYEANVPGGVDAVLSRLGDKALAEFFRQDFGAVSWADAVPTPYLLAAAARVRGVTYEAHVRDIATWHAKHALYGFYRTLLKVMSAETLAMWIPRLSSSYHDFGTISAKPGGPNRCAGLRTGIPRQLVRWWTSIAAGYMTCALEFGGCRGGKMRVVSLEKDTPRLGYETWKIGYEVSWL